MRPGNMQKHPDFLQKQPPFAEAALQIAAKTPDVRHPIRKNPIGNRMRQTVSGRFWGGILIFKVIIAEEHTDFLD